LDGRTLAFRASVAPGELQAAAQWMYYGDDLAEMLLLSALCFLWLRQSPAPSQDAARRTAPVS